MEFILQAEVGLLHGDLYVIPNEVAVNRLEGAIDGGAGCQAAMSANAKQK